MTTFVIDLFGLWAVMAVTAVALFGWGVLTCRLLGIEQPRQVDTTTAWLGVAVVLGAVELVHLFLPIDWKVSLVFAVIGIAAALKASDHSEAHGVGRFFAQWCDALQRFAVLLRQQPIASVLLALVVAAWCLRAMGTPNNYDSGLYHFQSVRWLTEQPIVFGLGNLHWRLALNQSYFGFLALLNLAPFWNKGYAAGGLLLLLLTLATTLEIGFTQSSRWRNVIGAVILVFLGLVAGSIANPSPDNAVALLEIVIFLFLFCLLGQPRADEASRVRLATVLVFLCSAVVTTKFSSAGFAAGCLIVVVWVSVVRSRVLGRVLSFRFMLVMGLMVLVHIVRGYVLSGAPLFPATWFGAWTLPWAVPPGIAKFETAFIYSWARLPGAEIFAPALRDGTWVLTWFKALGPGSLALFAVGTGLALFNVAWLLLNRRACHDRAVYALYAPTAGGLIFWFVTAPDVRFLGATLVLYCALSIYLTASQLQLWRVLGANDLAPVAGKNVRQDDGKIVWGKRLSIAVFGLACLLSLRYVGLHSISLEGWKPLPQMSVVTKRTSSGAEIWVPDEGNQCWDAALPCASLFNEALRAGQYLSHPLFAVKPD